MELSERMESTALILDQMQLPESVKGVNATRNRLKNYQIELQELNDTFRQYLHFAKLDLIPVPIGIKTFRELSD